MRYCPVLRAYSGGAGRGPGKSARSSGRLVSSGGRRYRGGDGGILFLALACLAGLYPPIVCPVAVHEHGLGSFGDGGGRSAQEPGLSGNKQSRTADGLGQPMHAVGNQGSERGGGQDGGETRERQSSDRPRQRASGRRGVEETDVPSVALDRWRYWRAPSLLARQMGLGRGTECDLGLGPTTCAGG